MKELVFEKQGEWNVCKVTDYTPGCAVHVTPKSPNAKLLVEANAPGMEPTLLETLVCMWDKHIMFALGLPAGLEVTLRTRSEVVAAKIV